MAALLSPVIRRRFVLLLSGLVALALAGSAHAAGRAVDRAEAALRSGRLYVDPKAQFKPQAVEERQLRARLRSAHAPIYVAVLPAQAAGERARSDARSARS